MTSLHKKSFAAEQLKRQQQEKKTGLWIILAVVGVAVIIGGYALYLRFSVKEEPAPATEEIKSIAVLPFVDMSPEKDQEYFCDGIAEEILNALTHVGGLKVIARSSSFSFKGITKPIQEIGRELGVKWVVEGSVRKADNRVRVTAQLINVADLSHLWSEKYDRSLDDIFAIQDTISLAIVEALKVKLLTKEKTAITKQPTEDIGAYDLFLLGRHFDEKGIPDDENHQMKALDYYLKAIAKDPDFALAYAKIADIYNSSGYFGNKEHFQKGKEMAQKALELDNTLAEAHAELGFNALYSDWDWQTTEKEFKRSIELNPGYAKAYRYYRDYYHVVGPIEKAVEMAEQSYATNPFSRDAIVMLIRTYIYARRLDSASELIESSEKMFEQGLWGYRMYIKILKGNYVEALDDLRKYSGIPLEENDVAATIYALMGKREKAKRIIDSIIDRMEELSIQCNTIAGIYANLDNNDEVFTWLEKAYERRETIFIWLKTDPVFDPIRSDPRYKALLKKMGLE